MALTPGVIKDTLDKLRGAVMIVYPMGLPPYDEVRLIIEDKEELAGKQASACTQPPRCVNLTAGCTGRHPR